MSRDPKTLAEALDETRDGTEFAAVINRLFGILEAAKDEEAGQ